ncbi:HEWD family protein [Halanaeroarchaeum sulfurireducens]
MIMSAQIRTPTHRTCVRCGREERYDEEEKVWKVTDAVGDIYCIHSWDITGEFTPVVQ